ncbi:MAG: macro domain-containing protein [Ignavibacteria bacterium]|nr:macro domain-containing protein [Ignavibacteria bacterium]
MNIIHGNIFATDCQTIVNTVNCDGFMGKGLALECRFLYPDAFTEYAAACTSGTVATGTLQSYRAGQNILLNFPTKRQWHLPSKIEYLDAGLRTFVETYEGLGITSVAFPLLGTQNGGLDETRVLDLMARHLDQLPIRIEVYRHDPRLVAPYMESLILLINSIGPTEFGAQARVKAPLLRAISEAVESGAATCIADLLSLPKVGDRTIERLFATRARLANALDQQSLFV